MITFFGGVCQYIAGIMEFISGNTFGATVFSSYGAFNISYAMIYLPGSGIIAAYTDKTTGEISPEFDQALAMFIWAWFILTVIYTGAACRASWVLFLDLAFLDLDLALLACGYMTGNQSLLIVGNSVGFVVAVLSCKSSPRFLPGRRSPTFTNRLGWHSRSLCWRRHTVQYPYLSHVPGKGLVGKLCCLRILAFRKNAPTLRVWDRA
jgi:hypothetical protein